MSIEEENEEIIMRHNPDDLYTKASWIVRSLQWSRVYRVIDFIDAKEDDRIIDLGCGAGNLLNEIKRGDLTGVDLSDTLLKKAGERLGKRARLVKASIENLPFQEKSFDKIICSEVLEHIPDVEFTLNEMMRIATDDVTVVLTFPNEGFTMFLKKLVKKLGLERMLFKGYGGGSVDLFTRGHLHIFNRDFVKFLRSKFKDVKVTFIPFLLLPLNYVVRCKGKKESKDSQI